MHAYSAPPGPPPAHHSSGNARSSAPAPPAHAATVAAVIRLLPEHIGAPRLCSNAAAPLAHSHALLLEALGCFIAL